MGQVILSRLSQLQKEAMNEGYLMLYRSHTERITLCCGIVRMQHAALFRLSAADAHLYVAHKREKRLHLQSHGLLIVLLHPHKINPPTSALTLSQGDL